MSRAYRDYCLFCGKWYKGQGKDYCSLKCSNKSRIGFKHSEKVKKNLSEKRKGSNNPMWRGNFVGYSALHGWIKRRIPRPELCQFCGIKKALDLANISQQYKRDLKDWEWLCRRCHMIKDGRMLNLKQYEEKRLAENEKALVQIASS